MKSISDHFWVTDDVLGKKNTTCHNYNTTGYLIYLHQEVVLNIIKKNVSEKPKGMFYCQIHMAYASYPLFFFLQWKNATPPFLDRNRDPHSSEQRVAFLQKVQRLIFSLCDSLLLTTAGIIPERFLYSHLFLLQCHLQRPLEESPIYWHEL